jgi:hypothetical protein
MVELPSHWKAGFRKESRGVLFQFEQHVIQIAGFGGRYPASVKRVKINVRQAGLKAFNSLAEVAEETVRSWATFSSFMRLTPSRPHLR